MVLSCPSDIWDLVRGELHGSSRWRSHPSQICSFVGSTPGAILSQFVKHRSVASFKDINRSRGCGNGPWTDRFTGKVHRKHRFSGSFIIHSFLWLQGAQACRSGGVRGSLSFGIFWGGQILPEMSLGDISPVQKLLPLNIWRF